MTHFHLIRLAAGVEGTDCVFDTVGDFLEIGSRNRLDIHHAEVSPRILSPDIECQRSHRVLQALEVEVLYDAHDLGIALMASHQAAHVKLRIHLHECLIDNHTACFVLVVGRLEATPVHHLEVEKMQEIIGNGKHFRINLLSVDGTAPTHLPVGDDQVVGKSHIRDGRILQ